MNLLQFIFTKDFLKHLIIAIVVAIVIFSSSFMFLNVYTHHGDSFPLPDFGRLTLREAQKLAMEYDVKVEVTDSVYQDNWPRGTVVKQNPPAMFHVKEGRKIFFTMNASSREMVKMPNVVGVSHRHAKAILYNAGLKIGKLTHEPDIALNNVLKQKVGNSEVEPGELIPSGTRVDLVLGKGYDGTSKIPDLAGLRLNEARERIFENAMNLGTVRYDYSFRNGRDTLRGFVWRQYPPYLEDERINLGSYIDLWMTIDSSRLPEPDTLISNLF